MKQIIKALSLIIMLSLFTACTPRQTETARPPDITETEQGADSTPPSALPEGGALYAPDPAPQHENAAVRGEHEDAELSMWFDSTYNLTPAEQTAHNGRYTYTMRLAKNESESCQLLLASPNVMDGISVTCGEFTNESGGALRTELFLGCYFSDVGGQTAADPLAPLDGGFRLEANKSQTVLIKVSSLSDTESGEYSSSVSVRDKNGRELKRATIYAYVWDFTLPEQSSCKTQLELSRWNIENTHGADGGELYASYYELLLDNRLCAYDLPYNTGGTFSDSRTLKYLLDPRVNAFCPTGYNIPADEETMKKAYSYLSQEEAWLDKAYFLLNSAVSASLPDGFPGANIITPGEQSGGELWYEIPPYRTGGRISLTLGDPAVDYRILLWQLKLMGADGFIYCSSNDWYTTTQGDGTSDYGWNTKQQTADGREVYGSGTLIYSGKMLGTDAPVSSLRLECLRDGIEDFEYFTLIEQKYGTEACRTIICEITTSAEVYTSDAELFTALRTAAGNLLAYKQQ